MYVSVRVIFECDFWGERVTVTALLYVHVGTGTS